ncbi:MAG TPA: site-specific integrase [Polyangiaceae bacterium]|nr:site-specific integrase [Polyangiaceae bacterium]
MGLVCALAAYAGLRSGEVRALQVGEVSLKRGEIHVCRAISADEVSTTKSDQDRIVPISPELRPMLVRACKGKRARDLVVVTETGTTPMRQTILNRVKRVQDPHGLRAHSFHSLRHYFCSALIDRGIPVPVVQRAAGHSDLKTTQRYVHALRSLDAIWG